MVKQGELSFHHYYVSHLRRFQDSSLSLFSIRFGIFHEVRLDESVDFAVHHAVHVARLESRAMVFHAAVVKHVASDLASPFNLFLSRFNLGLCRFSFLEGAVVEL